MDVTELLAALPPREIADMLVYRCLDSQEPSLSMNLDAFIDVGSMLNNT